MSDTLQQLIQFRLDKTQKLRELGVNPYPYAFDRTHMITGVRAEQDALIAGETEVAVAGRLMAIRAGFADIQDADGRLQIYVHKQFVDELAMQTWKLMDIGDIIGVRGPLFKTRTGELSVQVKQLTLLSKSIRPLPVVKTTGDKAFDAVTDKDFRYRRRYVDLTINPDTREIFVKRAKIISTMRRFLEDRGCLEVETPTLQPIYGGASARPFTTHHNALDTRLYMRIALELYLKRLIVGGFDGVYEISKVFRNEGLDRFHNPEFTMMELYVAYKDYHWMMDLVEQMIHDIAVAVTGSAKVQFQGHEIDLTPPWKRISMLDAIEEFSGYDLAAATDDEARAVAKKLELAIEDWWDRGKVIDEIFGEKVEPNLIQPTFVIDYPVEISPLAKLHRSRPGLVERFEPVIGGKEIGNAFSELSDPVDQKQRFERQMNMKAKGDPEAQVMDEDYVMALEYGMPPTAGLGIGIDRLVMLLTDSPSIRDVVLFPQMRPEEGRGSEDETQE